MAKQRRRIKGEGSWGKRKINDIEYFYFNKEYNGNDKTFYGRTQQEVKDKKEKFEKENGYLSEKEISQETFGEYMENWLKTKKRFSVKPTTYDGYETDFKNYILNHSISNIQIGALNDDILQNYFNDLTLKYSKGSINKARTLINQCLEYAFAKKNITANYMSLVTMPNEANVAKKKKEAKFLSEEDMDKLYQESKRINEKGFNFGGKIGQPVYGNNAKAIVLIEYTGLRVGELLGLLWSDYNKESKKLTIKNNIVTVKNRNKKSEDENNYIKTDSSVKTPSSERIIHLNDKAIEMLDYFEKQNPNHKPNDNIILNKNGNILGQRNLTKTLNSMQIRAKCEVEKCGLHALRHSFGSYLLLNGVDIKIVSSLLGHKDITTTYNIYIHLIEKQKMDAIDVFNKFDK
jgi:site-specific recombinase XerD